MNRLNLIVCLLALTMFSYGNGLKYFEPVDKTDDLTVLQNAPLNIKVIFAFKKYIHNDLIKDSVMATYRISIDSLNGNFFGKRLFESYIEGIDKWMCNIPYFMSTCAPKEAIFIEFGKNGKIASSRISGEDLDNGFFIIKSQKNTYRYRLNNYGINGIKKFFSTILALTPDDIENSCK